MGTYPLPAETMPSPAQRGCRRDTSRTSLGRGLGAAVSGAARTSCGWLGAVSTVAPVGQQYPACAPWRVLLPCGGRSSTPADSPLLSPPAAAASPLWQVLGLGSPPCLCCFPVPWSSLSPSSVDNLLLLVNNSSCYFFPVQISGVVFSSLIRT